MSWQTFVLIWACAVILPWSNLTFLSVLSLLQSNICRGSARALPMGVSDIRKSTSCWNECRLTVEQKYHGYKIHPEEAAEHLRDRSKVYVRRDCSFVTINGYEMQVARRNCDFYNHRWRSKSMNKKENNLLTKTTDFQLRKLFEELHNHLKYTAHQKMFTQHPYFFSDFAQELQDFISWNAQYTQNGWG